MLNTIETPVQVSVSQEALPFYFEQHVITHLTVSPEGKPIPVVGLVLDPGETHTLVRIRLLEGTTDVAFNNEYLTVR